ncbi:DNA-binding protein [Burkholderia seminalis]|uniref:DNA-binding protein n=2 Tax=Burkholderia cepacia complex TaxID=87882 RepID=A0A8A8DHN7_9BURK|nr:DNA-binding protein [Burkholderia seminalis]QTO23911.1 DNA-binding protein [Burkholderia seminalis]
MPLDADLQLLHARALDTQTLYREVCALLFFRYGETPTANKLYQLVRKGSMSAPAKALRDFWTDVREKSRVDVGQPDIPVEVAHLAGELAATVWRQANEAADNAFAAFRDELQVAVDRAKQRSDEADARYEAALAVSRAAEEDVAGKTARIAELEARLVEQQTVNTMLREQLDGTRAEANSAAAALADTRRDFAAALEKLRQSLSQNEQRLIAAEKRALLEIENERAAATRARADSQAATGRLAELDSTYRAERDSMREKLMSLNGQLASTEQRQADLQKQLTDKDVAFAQQSEMAAALRQQLEVWTTAAVSAAREDATQRLGRRLASPATRKPRRDIKPSSDVFKKRRPT